MKKIKKKWMNMILINIKDSFSSMEFDNGLLYIYTKNQIEFYKEIVKKFSHINFILRPHPTDFEFIKRFQNYFLIIRMLR